jgi:hypothetical protein
MISIYYNSRGFSCRSDYGNTDAAVPYRNSSGIKREEENLWRKNLGMKTKY